MSEVAIIRLSKCFIPVPEISHGNDQKSCYKKFITLLGASAMPPPPPLGDPRIAIGLYYLSGLLITKMKKGEFFFNSVLVHFYISPLRLDLILWLIKNPDFHE